MPATNTRERFRRDDFARREVFRQLTWTTRRLYHAASSESAGRDLKTYIAADTINAAGSSSSAHDEKGGRDVSIRLGGSVRGASRRLTASAIVNQSATVARPFSIVVAGTSGKHRAHARRIRAFE